MSDPNSPEASADKPVRIGIIGAGWWAAVNHIPALMEIERAELVAICSLDSSAISKIQSEFGAIDAFDNHEDMLKSVELDGVIVSSPHQLHYVHAKAALEAGCNVLVEKPFTTDVAEAKNLIQLSEEKGLTLSVSHGWNYMPITRDALKLIRQGFIGEVQHVALQLASPTSDLFSGKGLILAKDHLVQPQNSTWADPSRAGGYGWGQLTHLLGLFFKLIDEDPADVFAFTSLSEAGVDYYNAICMHLGNGASGTISGSSNMPSSKPRFQVDIKVFGTDGNFFMDLESGRERVVVETMSGEAYSLDLPEGAGDYDGASPVRHLVDACHGKQDEDMAPAIVGLRSIAFLDAMYRSAASGRVESVAAIS